jgi:hypothetical protein
MLRLFLFCIMIALAPHALHHFTHHFALISCAFIYVRSCRAETQRAEDPANLALDQVKLWCIG